MEGCMPQAELLVPENEIGPDNNIDINEDNFAMDEEESFYDDDSDSSLRVLLPDENGEPPLRIVEIPSEFDLDENFDIVSKDGMDFGSLFEISLDFYSKTYKSISDKSSRVKVQRRSGKRNVIPDALSRSINYLNIESFQPDKWYLNIIKQVKDEPDKFPHFKDEDQYLYKFPLRSATTKPIIKISKEQVFSIFGVPQIVVFDNGSQFVSKQFCSFLDSVKVSKVWLNAKYYPPINPTERVTRVLVTTISSYIKNSQHREWNKHIFETAQAIRSARHDSTQMSPNQLVFGRHVPIYGDFYNSVDLDKPLKIDNI
ncbi:hypothetical protein ILUMI_18469 [Ignelater luminosus]|uniref:Integrase catalytic domain-containing protein n=1 Tax=Ignelater luminosus TaxID=2038154 RepID=A0A8K0CJV0_IGNLU|nr:hypothetical protein ILUMI_18469 [Ignelater luminosus]